jgi:hypothetical protein
MEEVPEYVSFEVHLVDDSHCRYSPNLGQLSPTIVARTRTRVSLVIWRSRTSHKRREPVLVAQRSLNIIQRVLRTVRRHNIRLSKPVKRRKPKEVQNHSFEILNEIVILDILRAVAWDVESAEAGSMLAELVGPEPPVRLAPCDPEFFHVGLEVQLAEGSEWVDWRASVGWHWCSVRFSGGRVG